MSKGVNNTRSTSLIKTPGQILSAKVKNYKMLAARYEREGFNKSQACMLAHEKAFNLEAHPNITEFTTTEKHMNFAATSIFLEKVTVSSKFNDDILINLTNTDSVNSAFIGFLLGRKNRSEGKLFIKLSDGMSNYLEQGNLLNYFEENII